MLRFPFLLSKPAPLNYPTGALPVLLPRLHAALCFSRCCRHLLVCTSILCLSCNHTQSTSFCILLSCMLMTIGQMQHDALSSILVLVFSLISSDYKDWPTMPSSTAVFQSHILNPTNQHSLVSILPVPYVYMLHDQSHAYCCLLEISAYVLLLPRSTGAPLVPLHLTQLCQSTNMQNFLSTAPPIRTTKCLFSLGLVFWLDGWDPSASPKNNRSPIHTASVILL
jgi:hypothetical protein